MTKVLLLQKQRLHLRGYQRTYQAGEVVEIGRAEATRLIDLNRARLYTEAKNRPVQEMPVLEKPASIATSAPGDLPFPAGCLMIWDGSISVSRERMQVGFKLLDRWDVAVPLCDYSILACKIGNAKERERTQAVIRDLRVPVYETGLMFMRQNEQTAELLRRWKEENEPGGDTRLAFLRALYEVKPLILALPHTWIVGDKA